MSDGALKDYRFDQKNNWRWLMWKAIAKSVNPPTARVLLLPGRSSNDLFNMLSLKFNMRNVVCLDRDKDSAKQIRKTFAPLTVGTEVSEFVRHYPLLMGMGDELPFDVIFLDFCGGLTEHNLQSLHDAVGCLRPGGGILATNLLRGRDGRSGPEKHRAVRAVNLMNYRVQFMQSKLGCLRALNCGIRGSQFSYSVRAKAFRNYRSNTTRYDSFICSVRKAGDYEPHIVGTLLEHAEREERISQLEAELKAQRLERERITGDGDYLVRLVGQERIDEFAKWAYETHELQNWRLGVKARALKLSIAAARAVQTKQLA